MLINLNNGTEMNVFKITTLSLALATSAGSFSAMAVETSQIAVKGAVFPSACSISVDGVADFGNLKKNELEELGRPYYQLGYKPVNFNIQCTSTAKVALSAQAEIPAPESHLMSVTSYISETEKTLSSTPEQRGSLGLIDGHDIGNFTVALVSATVDGIKSKLIFTPNGKSSWKTVTGVKDYLMSQDGSVLHSWGKDATPQEATNISGVIHISASIDARTVDNMKDSINFNSGTTLSLQYL